MSLKKEIEEKRLYVAPINDLTNENDHSVEWGDYVLNQIEKWRKHYDIKESLKYMVYGNDEERQNWYRSDDVSNITQLVLERTEIPISATQMREYLVQNNRKKWMEFMPVQKLGEEQVNHLFEEVRKELLEIPYYKTRSA